MSHFAKIDKDNIVTEVIVAEQDFINTGAVGDSFLWVQTSYSGSFRKQFAGMGDTYDKVNDVFIKPQPFASWTLDALFDWQPPTALPVEATFADTTCETNHTSGLGSPASTSKITMISTAKVVVGMSVTGTGIAAGTTVSSIESLTVLVLSAATTETNIGLTLTFGADNGTRHLWNEDKKKWDEILPPDDAE